MVFVSLKYWSAWCNGLGPMGKGVFHLSIFESKNPTALHTDTWVYKNSKHKFCVFASKHAL